MTGGSFPGAGGVTGTMLVMLAAHHGLRVVATAGPSSRLPRGGKTLMLVVTPFDPPLNREMSGMSDDEVRHVFQTVDSFEPDEFVKLLAEDATLVFANAEPMVGHEAIAAGLREFYATIGGLRHRIVRHWRAGADTIAETEVTYRRLDGREVTVAAVTIWRTRDDGLIGDYRIFIDLAPVYAAA